MVISALFFLFLDEDYLKTLEEKWNRIFPKHFLFTAFSILFIIGFLQSRNASWLIVTIIGEHILWTLLFLALFLAAIRSPCPDDGKRKPFKSYQILIIALMFLNGSSPYLGLKTRTSFNMYSNLRLESGVSNHHFLGPSLDLFGHLADTVHIINVDPKKYEREDLRAGMLLTHFELSRFLNSDREDDVRELLIRLRRVT